MYFEYKMYVNHLGVVEYEVQGGVKAMHSDLHQRSSLASTRLYIINIYYSCIHKSLALYALTCSDES